MSILEAVKANDIARVRELLSSGINQNEGSWALHYAVTQGAIELVRILIHAGVDVNRELLMGREDKPILVEGSALRDAALEGHLNIVEDLLKAGANVNYLPRISDEGSALMLAAQEGHFEIVKKLVESGADVNIIRDGPSYALFSAASNGRKEIFDFLYPLIAPQLRAEALEILPQGMLTKQIEEDANPLVCQLTNAIIYDDIDSVRELLSAGVDINGYDEFGSRPLICAVVKRSIKLVQILLEAGANPDIKDIEDGRTPLIQFATSIWSEDDLVIASLLLEARCDVNVQDNEGFTALMCAVNHTPRNDEARLARLKGIEFLLRFDADIDIKNYENISVFELVRSSDMEVQNLLRQK